MWKRLTRQEREEFAHMLKDGRLASLVTIWTPWWMAEVGLSVSLVFAFILSEEVLHMPEKSLTCACLCV